MPRADDSIEAPEMCRGGVEVKGVGAVSAKSGFGERHADNGPDVHVVGDKAC